MIRRTIFTLLLIAVAVPCQQGGQLRFCLRAEPKTFNPILVDDQYSETVRYLTGGVLLRVNRRTQQVEPELALSAKIQQGGRKIVFRLRKGVLFSDGTPFTAEDVAYTMRALFDPGIHSPSADSFRSGSGDPEIRVISADSIAITFPSPIAALNRQFDQVAILSAH